MRRLVSMGVGLGVSLSIAIVAGCSDARPPMQGGVTTEPGQGNGYVPADTGVIDSGPPAVVDGYPAGPFGFWNGHTFPALAFDGYTDGSTTWSKVDMRSYFDPDGSKEVRAVVVIVAAPWCAVCQQEARWMPAEYLKSWKSRGARFITVLIEDVAHDASSQLVADQWRDAFSIPYAVAIDPAHTLVPSDVGVLKLPITYVIDPRTMRVEKLYTAAIAPPTIPALETVLTRNGG
jgi:hypothetical protein